MRLHHVTTLALLCAAPAAALAHHGWSSYDANKTLTLTAPVTEVRWANPHVAAAVQYGGKRWEVVLAPVLRMETRGLSADMLMKAKSVTLTGQPRKDGTPEMKIQRILVEGKEYNLLA